MDIPKEFETLCDKEFELGRREAFENLDREIVAIKSSMSSTGNLQSSSTALMIVDAVIARFDKVILAFEHSYLDKWADPARSLSASEGDWLITKLTEKIDPAISDVRSRCNTPLWDAKATFAGSWQKAEVTAREHRNIVLDKIEILRLRKKQGIMPQPRPSVQEPDALWDLMHPKIVKISRSRFESGHFADAAETAFKEVNDIVRQIVWEKTEKEFDGADLMCRAFSVEKPVIALDDPGTSTGRNIHVGYMQVFAGAMTGIRNPKAHANIHIDSTRALHFLFLASLLLFKIDERVK